MPAHLEVARSFEAHDNRAVLEILDFLGRVKLEAPRPVGSTRRKLPNHLAVLGIVVEGAERSVGIVREAEVLRPLEARREQLGCTYVLYSVVL
jgi:hypothetical protein